MAKSRVWCMKQIYLFKGFFILCAVLFSTNFFQMIQYQQYSVDTLFQLSLALVSTWLSLNIREAVALKSIQLETARKSNAIQHSHY